LLGGRERMLRLLKSSPVWTKMLRKETNGLQWISKGVRDYESAAKRFLEYLLILTHITGGQPGRGTEIMTLRYANAMQSMRNVFVKEGQVMIVTEYHKSMAMMGQVKIIPRFLPERVGKLLVVYLADVPCCQLMDRKTAMLTSKGFLLYLPDIGPSNVIGHHLNLGVQPAGVHIFAVGIGIEGLSSGRCDWEPTLELARSW
jgi:hypothetical protein